MPKYKIVTEDDKSIVETPLEVNLEDMDDGEVSLVVDDWYVATLTSDGCLRLASGVSGDIGLEITDAGYIKVTR